MEATPQRARSYVASLVLFHAILSACVDSHDVVVDRPAQSAIEPKPAAAPARPTGLCTRFAQLVCRGEQQCCDAPGRSTETCLSEMAQECEQELYLDQVAAHSSAGFDQSAADAAFEELEQLVERCDPGVVRWSLSQSGLRGMFKGTLVEGQSCKPAQALTADRATQASALLSCGPAEDIACLPKSLLGEWSCAAKQPIGASCVLDENCEANGFCDMPDAAALGRCTERLPLSALCSTDTQCASFACRYQSCVEADAQAAYCPRS